MKTAGWLKGLRVTVDGTGIVPHGGMTLVRALSDTTGLTAGLSKALAAPQLVVHDRGRVMADLAYAIAGGACCDDTTEPLAGMLRPGSAGSDTACSGRELSHRV